MKKQIVILLLMIGIQILPLPRPHRPGTAPYPQEQIPRSPMAVNELLEIARILQQENSRSAADRIADLAGEIDTPDLKKYYMLLAEGLRENRLETPFLFWQSLTTKPDPSLIIHLRDGRPAPLVLSPLPDLQNRYRNYLQYLHHFLTAVNFTDPYGIFPGMIAPIFIGDLWYPDSPDSFSGILAAGSGDERTSYAVVFYRNVMVEYFQKVIQPKTAYLLANPPQPDIDDEIMLFFHWMNRLAYFISYPLSITGDRADSEIRTIAQTLPRHLMPLAEIKANSAAVAIGSVLAGKELLTRSQESALYQYYLLYLLKRLAHQTGETQDISSLVQFNHLVEKNCLIFNLEDRKAGVDVDRARPAVLGLCRSLIALEKTADPKAIKTFFQRRISGTTILNRILTYFEFKEPDDPSTDR